MWRAQRGSLTTLGMKLNSSILFFVSLSSSPCGFLQHVHKHTTNSLSIPELWSSPTEVVSSVPLFARFRLRSSSTGGNFLHICAHIATVFVWRTTFWWVSTGKKHSSWWCAICGEEYDCRAPNRLLVVHTGDGASRAKVFTAHSVPQSLRENLINALKLRANQQKYGDSPVQSIVTKLCERSRKGIVESLRNKIEVDNHSALDVGELKKGTRPF